MLEEKRDYSYEALAEVTGTDWNIGRGELNVALKSIREQSEIKDDYLLAAEIHERAKLYRALMPEVLLTAPALAKHWRRVAEEPLRRRRGENLSAEGEPELAREQTRLPEWVLVYRWARSQRKPRNLIAFPQQRGFVDETEMLSQAKYEALCDEWLAEGSPKAEHPLPLAGR